MLDEEALLAALGVAGEGAVREAEAARLVDHVDDPCGVQEPLPPNAWTSTPATSPTAIGIDAGSMYVSGSANIVHARFLALRGGKRAGAGSELLAAVVADEPGRRRRIVDARWRPVLRIAERVLAPGRAERRDALRRGLRERPHARRC